MHQRALPSKEMLECVLQCFPLVFVIFFFVKTGDFRSSDLYFRSQKQPLFNVFIELGSRKASGGGVRDQI